MCSNPEEMDNIIVLTNEDGNDVEFWYLASVEYNGAKYCVLNACEGDGEVSIMECIEEEDDDGLEKVPSNMFVLETDPEIIRAVFKIFREENKDLFFFFDEEDE